MPNLGGPELVIVLLIFILLFGARKLPELGSSVGKSIKSFKRGLSESDEDEPKTETAAEHREESAVPPQSQTSRDLQ
ncbi:MAG: twin-arginine translocase TatA/TatE family subunit [Egibacteraceae bacterium]